MNLRLNLLLITLSALYDPSHAFVVGGTQRIRTLAVKDSEDVVDLPPITVGSSTILKTKKKRSPAPNPFAVETQDPLRQPGVLPSETVVESASDLESFLFDDQNDGRVTVVKYHASWYVYGGRKARMSGKYDMQ